MSIKVFLVDDHRIIREGIRALFQTEPDIEVVGEAENGRKALELIPKTCPDLVIMDVTMPDMNGIEAARLILKKMPGIKIIALSMHADKQFVMAMFKAGVSGYLLKECAAEELIHAVRASDKNLTCISSAINDILIAGDGQAKIREKLSVYSLLTLKEVEVLKFLAEGKTTKEIAYSLHISIKTVEVHRHHIMRKVGVHSIAELTKYAIREGLTSLE